MTSESNDKIWRGKITEKLDGVSADIKDIARKLEQHLSNCHKSTFAFAQRISVNEGEITQVKGAMGRLYKLIIGVAIAVIASAIAAAYLQ